MGRVFFNKRERVSSILGNYQALASDSGTVFFNNVAAAATFTLPSISAGDALDGWSCKIIIETNVTSGNFTITEGAGDTDILVVSTNEQQNNAAPAGTSSGCTNVLLANGADAVGDSFTILCSGSKFYINADVKADAAVTVS